MGGESTRPHIEFFDTCTHLVLHVRKGLVEIGGGPYHHTVEEHSLTQVGTEHCPMKTAKMGGKKNL